LLQDFAIVPAVDVLDGKAVRLLRGDYDSIEVDAGDPLALVRKAAATAPPLVHVVALGAARDGGAPVELAAAVVEAAAPVPVQLGGGVRAVEDARALADAGIARVMIGTAAFGEIPLERFVEAVDVVVAVDVANGIVRTAGWRESAGLTTAEALARCTAAGVRNVLCTAIERDGSRSGPDLELLREVRAAFGGHVLAAAGIRDREDVEAVRALGIDGVVVGRAWLDGTLTLGS
jgi:phosphoribosylformimino-5-aminoimidazole carboxamide ribotide isomerase